MPIRTYRGTHIAVLAAMLLAGTAFVIVPSSISRAQESQESEHAGHGGMKGGMEGGGMHGCKMMGGDHSGMMGGGMGGMGGMEGGGMHGCEMMGGGHGGMMGGDHAGMKDGDHAGMGQKSGMKHGEMRKRMHEMMLEMASRVDERLAAVKSDLAITDAQLPQWNAFADAVRSAAKSREQMHKEMMASETAAAEAAPKPAADTEPTPGGDKNYPGMEAVKKVEPTPAPAPQGKPAESLPEKLAAHEKRLVLHLESLKAIEAALVPLYATLDDKQKKVVDALKIGPMGLM